MVTLKACDRSISIAFYWMECKCYIIIYETLDVKDKQQVLARVINIDTLLSTLTGRGHY